MSTDGQAYQCPDNGYAVNVFNPSGDFEIVAHTYYDGDERPTLAYHKTRPIIAVPWQKDGTYGTLTQDGRQLMKNSFSWVETARARNIFILLDDYFFFAQLESTHTNAPTKSANRRT